MQEVVSGGDALMPLYLNSSVLVDEVSTTAPNYDIMLQQLSNQIEVNNTLLLRISDLGDIALAVFIALIIVGVFYTMLKGFTRF